MGDPSVCLRRSVCRSSVHRNAPPSFRWRSISLSPLVGSGPTQVINKPVWIEADAQTQTRRPRARGVRGEEGGAARA